MMLLLLMHSELNMLRMWSNGPMLLLAEHTSQSIAERLKTGLYDRKAVIA
jgi:hypothetical protein